MGGTLWGWEKVQAVRKIGGRTAIGKTTPEDERREIAASGEARRLMSFRKKTQEAQDSTWGGGGEIWG